MTAERGSQSHFGAPPCAMDFESGSFIPKLPAIEPPKGPREQRRKKRKSKVCEPDHSFDEPEPTGFGPDAAAVGHAPGPRPPQCAPPSALSPADILDLTVALDSVDWAQRGFNIFSKEGFVIVSGVLKLHQYSRVLRDCEEQGQALRIMQPGGNRGRNRWSFGNASLTKSMFHIQSWSKYLLRAAGGELRELLQLIFGDDGCRCVKSGGDFVLGRTRAHQKLHADIQVKKQLDIHLPPPQLSVNFTLQPLTPDNGPLRIVPRTQLARVDAEGIPVELRNARLCPVPAGAAIVRDIRVLHSGTPNWTTNVRYLPNVEFASAPYIEKGPFAKQTPQRSMPRQFFDQLPPEVQELCGDLV